MAATSAARRSGTFLVLSFLTGAIVLLETSVSSAGEACSGSCSGGNCIFGEMLNVPLGDASISINPECQLVVDDIGESAEDGVVQTELDSVYMKTTLATPNFSMSIVGSLARIRQVGIVDGQPGGEVMLTRIWGDGANVGLSINCTALFVAGYSIDIYNDGVLAGHVDHDSSPPILLYPKEDLRSIACGIYPDADVYTVIELGGPQPITVTSSTTNPGPFVGDMLFVEAFGPFAKATSQTDIENRFFHTGPVTMAEMERRDILPCGGQFPFAAPCQSVPAMSTAGWLALGVALIAVGGGVLLSRQRASVGSRISA